MMKEIVEQRDDLLKANQLLHALIRNRGAEIERLQEALKPFAMVAEHDIGTDESDDDLFKPMNKHNRAPRLKVGDFRRSLAAVGSSGSCGK